MKTFFIIFVLATSLSFLVNYITQPKIGTAYYKTQEETFNVVDVSTVRHAKSYRTFAVLYNKKTNEAINHNVVDKEEVELLKKFLKEDIDIQYYTAEKRKCIVRISDSKNGRQLLLRIHYKTHCYDL